MASGRRVFPDHPLVVGTLLLAVFAQAYLSARLKTATFDEPAHIGAGFSYLKTGEFKINQQHPPLLKEIGALPLLLIDAYWPLTEEAWAAVPDTPPRGLQWTLGQQVIFANDPGRVLFWTRLPFICLATLLGGLIYLWGRKLLGGTTAVAALFLYALDPNIVAHSQLVTTDLGFAAFGLLFLVALWYYLNHRTLKRLTWCGLALGAALATKFSALILIPIALLLLIGAIAWIPAAVPSRGSTLVDPYSAALRGQRFMWGLYALAAMGVLAGLVLYVVYFFPGDPFLYLRGLKLVNADHDRTYMAFMAGGFSRRFWSYYLLVYLLKEPLAILICVILGLVVMAKSGLVSSMDRAFLLVPPLLIGLVYTVLSHNLGIRYLIPALPFLYLVGGAGLVWLWRDGGGIRRLIAVLLCAWLAVAAAGIYPDHLSYFNETACLLVAPSLLSAAGGTACGPFWFDDSNVDWGQGLNQLSSWLDRHEPGRRVRLAYFGSIRPDFYLRDHVPLRVDDLLRPPSPGLHAISAHILARARGELSRRHGPGPENWLLHTRPTAIVGHSYYIYDIAPGGEGRRDP
jgi:hypothetical protein